MTLARPLYMGDITSGRAGAICRRVAALMAPPRHARSRLAPDRRALVMGRVVGAGPTSAVPTCTPARGGSAPVKLKDQRTMEGFGDGYSIYSVNNCFAIGLIHVSKFV